MTYVPRSPRKATRLRAVVDDGAHHAVGAVRDMSTSGLFVEASAPYPLGTRVAVVPLVGELDGQRLPAEVARVSERGGVALRFIGLDPEQRQRLRSTIATNAGLDTAIGKNTNALAESSRPVRRPTIAGALGTSFNRRPAPVVMIPDNAPVFLLTDEPAAPERPSALSGDAIAEMRQAIEELETQLVELGRRNGVLMDENGRLKREAMSLTARLSVAQSLRTRVDDDLAEARATIEDLERGEDALVRRIQLLEDELRRCRGLRV